MPHLVSERSLAGATKELAQSTKARFTTGHVPVMETVAMPKQGLGPRPIGLLSPEARTLYEGLVESLKSGLPSPSRDRDMDAHNEFGIDRGEADDVLLVDFDIAACYEYINHEVLTNELLLQTLNEKPISALGSLLGDVFPRGVGIPQAMECSHLLADAYLNQLERGLVRAGYQVDRYADDFRVISASWGEAHEAIERAVEIARGIGLVLADGKTKIRSARQVRREKIDRESAFQRYRDSAADELSSIEHVRVGYDDFDVVLTEADDDDVDFAALSEVVKDWAVKESGERGIYTFYGTRALKVLTSAPNRINDDWLSAIAQREPIRLFNIAKYVTGRDEVDENWSTLAQLTLMPRQSPWARLWMLNLGNSFESGWTSAESTVIEWAVGLLDDRFESVRAEAAWFLAMRQRLTSDRLGELYVAATDVTRIGLAACAGKLDAAKPTNVGKALRADSALTKPAFEWGASFAG
ncbi:RNA-directed DNA polymerase [Arthrobacter sp. StoSoilB5]|uniref:RNA-directed DNA polymerase n=1 Tax=Arthrobacter sp. StoSoilB5 TaxID=2830992 RepID=UPI0031FE503E